MFFNFVGKLLFHVTKSCRPSQHCLHHISKEMHMQSQHKRDWQYIREVPWGKRPWSGSGRICVWDSLSWSTKRLLTPFHSTCCSNWGNASALEASTSEAFGMSWPHVLLPTHKTSTVQECQVVAPRSGRHHLSDDNKAGSYHQHTLLPQNTFPFRVAYTSNPILRKSSQRPRTPQCFLADLSQTFGMCSRCEDSKLFL